MERYKIYCTEEQTYKAFKLGAPIKTTNSRFDEDVSPICKEGAEWLYAVIPTAEEMIGWIEEQKMIYNIEIFKFYNQGDWRYHVFPYVGAHISNKNYSSRCEATLAAINAALEYLSNKKQDYESK